MLGWAGMSQGNRSALATCQRIAAAAHEPGARAAHLLQGSGAAPQQPSEQYAKGHGPRLERSNEPQRHPRACHGTAGREIVPAVRTPVPPKVVRARVVRCCNSGATGAATAVSQTPYHAYIKTQLVVAFVSLAGPAGHNSHLHLCRTCVHHYWLQATTCVT